jgi:hypothetical protein
MAPLASTHAHQHERALTKTELLCLQLSSMQSGKTPCSITHILFHLAVAGTKVDEKSPLMLTTITCPPPLLLLPQHPCHCHQCLREKHRGGELLASPDTEHEGRATFLLFLNAIIESHMSG